MKHEPSQLNEWDAAFLAQLHHHEMVIDDLVVQLEVATLSQFLIKWKCSTTVQAKSASGEVCSLMFRSPTEESRKNISPA